MSTIRTKPHQCAYACYGGTTTKEITLETEQQFIEKMQDPKSRDAFTADVKRAYLREAATEDERQKRSEQFDIWFSEVEYTYY